MQCKAVFESFQKLHLQIYKSQFMTSYISPLPLALLNLESVEREIITKIWISPEKKKKKNPDEIKTFFIVFKGLSFGEKIKI